MLFARVLLVEEDTPKSATDGVVMGDTHSPRVLHIPQIVSRDMSSYAFPDPPRAAPSDAGTDCRNHATHVWLDRARLSHLSIEGVV